MQPCVSSRRRISAASRPHNHRAEVQLGWPGPDAFYSTDASTSSPTTHCDVIGLGQAMIDFSAAVDDSLLDKLQVDKGARRCDTPFCFVH